MVKRIAMAAALVLALVGAGLCEEGPNKDNPLEKLKKVLKEMKMAEKLLAQLSLEKGTKAQEEALKELRKLDPEFVKKNEETLKNAAQQIRSAEQRMKKIIDDIDHILQNIKFSKGNSQSQMNIKSKDDKSKKGKSGKQKPKPGEADKIKKMRDKAEKKKGGSSGGKTEANSKGGPADRSYENTKPVPKVSPPRKASGAGRWGDLPSKHFRDIIHPEDQKIPQKYDNLVKKYFEMLAKKAKKD
jgi:hypothetical protein